METFRLSALGIQPGRDSQAVRAELQPMLKGDAATFNDIFHRISLRERVVLGENIPQDKAKNLLEKFAAMGVECRLDPMQLSLAPIEEEGGKDSSYQCPACHHRQPSAVGGNPDICERCGVVGRNYEEANELKQALELERQRLKSTLDKKARKKLDAVREKAANEKEKAQQEAFERARRQMEKELGIRPWHKLKALLEPGVLYPILGSLAVGLIGVGLLVWQLRQSGPTDDQVPVANAQPAGVQVTVTPPPGAADLLEKTSAQVAQNMSGASDPEPAGTPSATAGGSAPADGAATAQSESGAARSSGPAPLLNVEQLKPVAATATDETARSVARNPQVLANLARYQIQVGDLAAAIRSIDRAMESLKAESVRLSSSQLDASNRVQAQVQAEIAQQYQQQRDSAKAQVYWIRATRLVENIKAPGERGPALSRLAQTMNQAQAATAQDYFKRAIEASRLIQEPFDQVRVLSAIAGDLSHVNRLDESQALFAQAETAVTKIQDAPGRLMAQALLAKHHAEAGNTTVAKTLLGQLAGEAKSDQRSPALDQYQAEAFSALALHLVKRGETAIARADFAAALQQAQALTEPTLRAEALLYLARDTTAAGDRAAAAKLVAAAGTWD